MAKVILTLTNKQVREMGWRALVRELGLSGATRFLLQYEEGEGNYTEERRSIFAEKNVANVAKEIMRSRK
jgi:hypothetical protein